MNLYIVTGTTRGLGAALASRIAAGKDNHLVAIARAPSGDIPGGERWQAELSDPGEVRAACERMERLAASRAFGKAVLINNAGVVSPVGPLDQVDPAELERAIAVNVLAPLLLMRGFLRATARVPVRRVVNISSGAGRRPVFGWGAYCASKAALDMASRVVALECASRGLAVDVVSLAPGVIDTPMQEVIRGRSAEEFVDVERFRQMKAEGVLRPADDVAADILRLEAEGRLRGEAVQDLRQLA